jgi:hypothetical protein
MVVMHMIPLPPDTLHMPSRWACSCTVAPMCPARSSTYVAHCRREASRGHGTAHRHAVLADDWHPLASASTPQQPGTLHLCQRASGQQDPRAAAVSPPPAPPPAPHLLTCMLVPPLPPNLQRAPARQSPARPPADLPHLCPPAPDLLHRPAACTDLLPASCAPSELLHAKARQGLPLTLTYCYPPALPPLSDPLPAAPCLTPCLLPPV